MQKPKIFLFTCSTEEKRNKKGSVRNYNGPPPLGILYLDTVMRMNNYEVLTKNYTYESEEDFLKDIECQIKNFRPSIVGLSILTITRVSAYKAIKLIKSIDKDIKIIAGGIHSSLMYEQLLNNFPIDIICIGDGEETIIEILKAYEKNLPFKNIRGVAYRENNYIIKTNPRQINMNLDKIPFPSHDVYSDHREINIASSRGCPNRCSFCSEGGTIWRARSPKNVVDEIEYLYKRYKELEHIYFWDENFTLNNLRAIEICKEIINRGIKLRFTCQSRIKPVSRELFYWMEKAGFVQIRFGIESGSEKVLLNSHKAITKQDILDTFNMLKEFKGIKHNKYLITGLYGETEETIAETIQFINQLNKINKRDAPDGNFYATPLMVFPGTEIYKIMKEKGLIDDSYWLSDKPAPIFTAEHSIEWINKMSNRIMIRTMLGVGKFFFIKKAVGVLIKNPSYVIKAIRKKVVTN